MGGRPAGWYADPMTVGAARYWDGRAWSDEVAWGGRVNHDSTPSNEVARRAARIRSDVVLDYLDEAVDREAVTADAADRLRRDLERLAAQGDGGPLGSVAPPMGGRWVDRPPSRTASTRPAFAPPTAAPPRFTPARAPSTAVPRTAVFPAPLTTARSGTPVAEPPEPIRVERGPLARWWSEASATVKSDLALHGIAYLGVLLLFVGVTGLISFSFGSVAPWVRTVTELAVPTSLLLSGWYLTRRGAAVVGTALTVLGGAMTPIVVAASFTDGSPVPPDVTGAALPIAQALAVAAVAVAMAVVVRHRPEHPLRYVVAPVAWTSIGLGVGAFRNPVPEGYETVRAAPIQLAAIMVAIAATAMIVRTRPVSGSGLVAATRSTLLPAAGIVYLLELLAAGANDWPWTSTVLSAIGLIVVAESTIDRTAAERLAAVDYLAVVVGSARLTATVDPVWVAVGASVALLALFERTGRLCLHRAALAMTAAVTAAGFAFTLTDRAGAVVAFSALGTWGMWRHLTPADWLPVDDRAGAVPATSALIVVVAGWELARPGAVMVAAAVGVLAIAVAGRLWPTVRSDALWRWFVPASASGIAVSTLVYPWGAEPVATALTAVCAAGAIAVSSLAPVARLWLSAPMLVWGAANLAERLELTTATQLVVLGSFGLVLLGVALAVDRPISAHWAMLGQLLGLGALTIAPSVGVGAVLAGMVTIEMLGTTIVDDRGGAAHLDWLRRVARSSSEERSAPTDAAIEVALDHLAPVATMLAAATTAVLSFDAVGWVEAGGPWAGVIVAAVAGSAATAARVVTLHRARATTLSWTALTIVLGAVVWTSRFTDDRDDWALPAAVAIAVAVVVLTRRPRPAAYAWVGWGGVLAEALLVADRTGLDRRWLDIVAAAWGFVVLVGALVVVRSSTGSATIAAVVADRHAVPPASIGAAAFVVGGVLGLSDGTDIEVGWTSAGLAAAVLTIALLTRIGALVAVTEVLATSAIALVAPWDPMRHPWSWAGWVAVLLAIAMMTRRSGPWTTSRWDVPTFVTAHGVAVLALAASIEVGGVDATFTLFGALSLMIAVVLRRWEWGVGAAVLLVVGAAAVGPGWFAAVLAVEGAVATALGVHESGRPPSWPRWALTSVGAAELVGAWFQLTVALDWTIGVTWFVTVPGGAGIALASALAWRADSTTRPLVVVWTLAGTVVSLGTAAIWWHEVDPRPGGVVLAGALVAIAAAAGALAAAADRRLRWLSMVVLAGAWLPLATGLELSTWLIAWLGSTLSVVVVAVVVLAHGRRPASPWIWPVTAFALLTQLGATVAALTELPDRTWTIVVLLAVAVELLGLGVASGRPEFFVAATPVASTAWLLFAGEALSGDANWFTMPIGLTLLVMTTEVRWIRRARGGDPASWGIVVPELIGMGFLVGSALARELAGDLWYGLLVLVVAVTIAGWGIATKVRWRAGFGVSMVIVGAITLIGIPLVRSITWTGPALWVSVAGLGIAAIAIASVLERSRDRIAATAARIGDLTDDWEQMPVRTGGSSHGRTGSRPDVFPPPSRPGTAS